MVVEVVGVADLVEEEVVGVVDLVVVVEVYPITRN